MLYLRISLIEFIDFFKCIYLVSLGREEAWQEFLGSLSLEAPEQSPPETCVLPVKEKSKNKRGKRCTMYECGGCTRLQKKIFI